MKLRECPFCGGEAVMWREERELKRGELFDFGAGIREIKKGDWAIVDVWYVGCPHCGFSMARDDR